MNINSTNKWFLKKKLKKKNLQINDCNNYWWSINQSDDDFFQFSIRQDHTQFFQNKVPIEGFSKKKKVPIKRKFLPSPGLQGHQAKQNM